MHAHCLVARLKQEGGFAEVEREEESRRRIIWPASPITSSIIWVYLACVRACVRAREWVSVRVCALVCTCVWPRAWACKADTRSHIVWLRMERPLCPEGYKRGYGEDGIDEGESPAREVNGDVQRV